MHASPSRAAAVLAALATSCLAVNPPEDTDGSDVGEATATDTDTDTGPIVREDSMLGCPAGETCRMVFVAESFDDRIEIFAPDDPTNAYRGSINVDFRMGTDSDNLDEPFGIVLGPDFLHIMAGHYPVRLEGTMVSLPRTMLGEYDAGTDIPVEALLLGGAFQQPVVATPFGMPEPIFAVARPLFGRIVIGAFNNDLFSTEDLWQMPGEIIVVDEADPTQFGKKSLSGLMGGDCLGAAQVVTMEDDLHVAVACDGNEAVAFLDLGDIGTGTAQTAAQVISGKLCDLPPIREVRTRYLAYDGMDGVIVGVGPGLTTGMVSGQVYSVQRDNCAAATPIDIGVNGNSHPGQIVRAGERAILVASGTPNETPDAKRGIYVLDTMTGLCDEPLPGFDAFWDTPGIVIEPFALAVDGDHLAVGAAVNAVRSGGAPQEVAYGKVLWATLSGVDDPCTMTATVVDLTDGGAGHAPAPNPPTLMRRAPHYISIAEVQG